MASRIATTLSVLAASQGIGLIGAAGAILLVGEAAPGPEGILWALLAGLSGVAGLAAFYTALARGLMSLVAPLGGVVAAGLPALIGLAGGDRLSGLQLLGLGVAVIAIGVSSLGQPSPDGAAPGAGRRQLLLVLGAGLGFAGFFLLIDRADAAGAGIWWTLALARVAGVAAVVAVAIALRERLRIPRRALGLTALSSTGDLGGNAFFLLSNAQGALSIAVVLSSLYPVTTVLLAWLILRERLTRFQVAAVALALAGVALIAI